ncbi:MAG: hypothetical protein LBH04_02490 [Tannerellaceae bacterium]|jgi:hypothetical protein|nr:hypothetical protein [Tannerellaceae bacterium]
MKYNQFDKEYYVMSIDRTCGHPLLACSKMELSVFLKDAPIDENSIEQPLEIAFLEPYPKPAEAPDLLILGGIYAGSHRLKLMFRKMNIYGVQFLPLRIVNEELMDLPGYYAIHFWNNLSAVDMDNYDGDEPNSFGRIQQLRRFSLNAQLLDNIPVWKRMVFMLIEKPLIIIVHQGVAEAVKEAGFRGISLVSVNEWVREETFI